MPTSSEDILLKLVIQGQDPAEIERLARSTQGQLNDRIKGYLEVLTQLHKEANAAIDKSDKERYQAMQARIDIANKQLDVVAKVATANEVAAKRIQKAHEEAAKKADEAWRKNIETLFHVVEIAKVTWETVEAGAEKFAQLAESVSTTTAIFNSLRGSIDEMREATSGEVADVDLIRAKNEALQKQLELTDKQFGIAAASANAYASVLGSNTTEALNKLLDGLASGNVKMLRSAGIVVEADKAYEAYAHRIGAASEVLSEHGKKAAIVEAALRAMDQKVADAGASIEHFGNKYEQVATKLKNIWTDILQSIGSIIVKAVEGFTVDLPDAIRMSIAKIKDMIPGGDGKYVERAVAQHDANLAAFYGEEENARKAAEAKERLGDQTNYSYKSGPRSDSIDKKKMEAAAKAADAIRRQQEEFNQKYELFLRGGKGAEVSGLDVPLLGEDQRSHDLDTAFDVTGSRRASPGGLSGSLARQAALQRAFAGKGERDQEDVDRQQQQAAEAMAKVNEDAMTEMLDRTDKLRERAGNGIFATLLFGPDGREQLLDDIDAFKNNAADAAGMVADAAHKMAEALGASLAAFVSGDKNKRKSIQDTTHDILQALATQAYARAIFETAEGFASLALGPIGGVSASQHFLAAGMFTAAGTAAGLVARAVGQSSAAGASTRGTGAGAGASGGYSGTSTSGGSFGSGGVRSSGGRGNDDRPINIQINSPLGDRAEIGRSVAIALSEYYARTGRGIPLAQGSV